MLVEGAIGNTQGELLPARALEICNHIETERARCVPLLNLLLDVDLLDFVNAEDLLQ